MDPTSQAQPKPEPKGEEQTVEGETLTFDGWVKDQPEEIRTLLDGHTKGLKSALDSERENRKGLEKQLRELSKKVEAGSELEKQLSDLADQQSSANRRAEFYEAAHREGVTNLKLAFTVAVQDELFNKKGEIDFPEMRKSYPELFGKAVTANANAGAGTGQPPTPKKNMNDFIRKAAGRA